MIPIQELPNRIRWDKKFGRGQFQVGYFDRVEKKILMIPFREVRFSEDNRRAFELIDAEGQRHRIPYHRVKEVYKNGALIWRRAL